MDAKSRRHASPTRDEWPRLVIGAGLEIRGDLIFVPTDSFGTPGTLNSVVLRQLNVRREALTAIARSERFARIPISKDREIVSVVTVSQQQLHWRFGFFQRSRVLHGIS